MTPQHAIAPETIASFRRVEWMMDTRQKGKTSAKAGTRRASDRRASPAHRSFIYKIGILRRLLDRYSSLGLTEQSGLTLAEWRVLTNLYSSSPTTSRQLCLHLHTDKAEVSRACAGLVAKGHASRRIDATDRRSALLVITPRGERLHDAIIPFRQALQAELEAPFSKAEVGELHRILDKLTHHVSGKIGSVSRKTGSAAAGAITGKHRARPAPAEKPRRGRSKAIRRSSLSHDHATHD